MLGILTDKQIDHVLISQTVGRIGCYSDDKIYIVPVSYVYHENYIYARSQEGLKIQKMRKNPAICFQVDSVENMANWRSVIVWGRFEELKNEQERKEGASILANQFTPLLTSESVRHSPLPPHNSLVIEKGLKAVIYRIKVTEKTGRYEKPDLQWEKR